MFPRSLAVLLALVATVSSAAERPNFVVIMADDLGYADLSCFGNDRYRTPRLDSLAARGLRFTDFHSNGAVCSPTRAALLTGRYQQRAGIPGVVLAAAERPSHVHGMQPVENTMGELLRDAGYRTAIFGKWHLGYFKKYNPVRHGFDRFRGYVSGNVDYFSHVDQAGRPDWWQGDELDPEKGYTTHLITKHAVHFIEESAANSKPFLAYVAHEAPHYPYQGPNDKPERTVGGTASNHGSRDDKAAAYREMVQEMDRGVGEIVASLERLGIEKNTLVLFFSDNGATRLGNNGVLRGFKGQVWEGGHRVPCIAYWPGRIKAGSTDELAITMDILPTLLELAGAPFPKKRSFDGVSLANVLLNGETLGERTLVWNGDAVRSGRWKLVRGARRGPRSKVMLFDLQSDIGEREDLGAKFPERVRALEARLDDWATDVARGATEQPASPLEAGLSR